MEVNYSYAISNFYDMIKHLTNVCTCIWKLIIAIKNDKIYQVQIHIHMEAN